jgi:membrane-bound lytic murein transglycosylase D
MNLSPLLKSLVTSCLILLLTCCTSITNSQKQQRRVHETLSKSSELSIESLDIINNEPLVTSVSAAAIQTFDDNLLSYDKTIWFRIQQQLDMHVPANQRVQKSRAWFLKHPEHLAQVSRRAEPFMHYIVDAVQARGLPLELALLPIIESAFDPFAYSHGSASGIWQFTAPTARSFGLKINWWYDGRRDIIKSTHAALDMLDYLYKKMDNNWLYAIASYNTGEGRIRRAIRRNKKQGLPTDFWSLNLPKETERYVPQLLALADVIKHSQTYGIELHPIPNQPKLEMVDIGSQIDLAFAANIAGMGIKKLHHLNPGFNQWATAPNGPHQLLLPKTHIQTFKNNLKLSSKDKRLKWVRYRVKAGDTLSGIAQKFKTTMIIIKETNQLRNHKLKINQHLLIAVASKSHSHYQLSAAERKKTRQKKVRGQKKLIYHVKVGDSFWKIAQKYQTTTRKLAYWNHMSPRDTLKVGQKLIVWAKESHPNQVNKNHTVKKVHYRIQKGDTLSHIAHKFKVSIRHLKEWNSMQSNQLRAGKVLQVYVDVTTMN